LAPLALGTGVRRAVTAAIFFFGVADPRIYSTVYSGETIPRWSAVCACPSSSFQGNLPTFLRGVSFSVAKCQRDITTAGFLIPCRPSLISKLVACFGDGAYHQGPVWPPCPLGLFSLHLPVRRARSSLHQCVRPPPLFRITAILSPLVVSLCMPRISTSASPD